MAEQSRDLQAREKAQELARAGLAISPLPAGARSPAPEARGAPAGSVAVDALSTQCMLLSPPRPAAGGAATTSAPPSPSLRRAADASSGWDTSVDVERMRYSDDGRTATKTNGPSFWNSSVLGQQPTARGRVELVEHGKANGLMVGLIDRAVFSASGCNYNKDGAYMIAPANGTLYGSGLAAAPFLDSPIKNHTVIECVHDRSKRTIAFVVDGVDRGVAFFGVRDADLHLTCNFHDVNTSVKLL